MPRRRARDVRTTVRTASRSGPRAGRSPGLGYGAYLPAEAAASCAPQAPVASTMATSGTLTYPVGGELEQVPRRVEAETEAKCEREHEHDGPGETEQRGRATRAGARPFRTGRQPEPGVESGQQEDQRERVRCQNEQRDEAESEQRDGLAGEDLLGRDPPPRHEPLPADEPPEQRERSEQEQREDRPVPGGLRGGIDGPPGRARPGAERVERVEREPGEEPDAETAAERADGGPERDSAAAAVREEVDGADEERDEQ